MFEQFSDRGRWLAAFLVAAVSGCSSQASVSGKVTYMDKPVTYGSVIFVGADKKASSAAINPDGTYVVEGLTPGTARIGVISRDPAKGRKRQKDENDAMAVKGWVPLPRQVEMPDNSGLTCTLNSGPNTHNIALK